MEHEKDLVSKLKKRLVHTSNEDLSLIPNNRSKKLNKKRIEMTPKPDRHRKVLTSNKNGDNDSY